MRGTLTIGDDSRPFDSWSESEVTQAIVRRRRDKQAVCVRFQFREACADVAFGTPPCGRGGGVPRELTQCERKLLNLWDKLRLNTPAFGPGEVVAFLKQAEHLLN